MNRSSLLPFTILMLLSSCCSAFEFKREQIEAQSEFSKCKEAAIAFAVKKKIHIQRFERPNVKQVSQDQLHALTKLPRVAGKSLRGACDYKAKTIYIWEIAELDVLWHEYGHWFFGVSEELADEFTEFVAEFAK